MTDITAIWTTQTGCTCPACRTARSQYHAAALDDHGDETTITIDATTYDTLAARANRDDYRDGRYVAFDRPIEWRDVMTDPRGL